MKRILYIYQFATLGGVERIILNRALAINDIGASISIDVCFLSDFGGIKALERAIKTYKLWDTLQIVPHPWVRNYDAIINIDTPQMLNWFCDHENYIYEVHTSRYDGVRILAELPGYIKRVVSPNPNITNLIQGYTDIPVMELRNFVYCNTPIENQKLEINRDHRTELFYIGRIEPGKNVTGILSILDELLVCQPSWTLTIVTPTIRRYEFLKKVYERGLLSHIRIIGPLDFVEMDRFIETAIDSGMINISCSLHESWGLVGSEVLARMGICFLAKNTGHEAVMKGLDNLLFDPRNSADAAKTIQRYVDGCAVIDNQSRIELVRHNRIQSNFLEQLQGAYAI